jgi:hypothetical protein
VYIVRGKNKKKIRNSRSKSDGKFLVSMVDVSEVQSPRNAQMHRDNIEILSGKHELDECQREACGIAVKL